jgi:hemolysin III
VTAFASVPAAIALLLHAGGVMAHVGAAVYGLTLVTLFVVSAVYHVHHWEPEPRRRMKRLDHSVIYVFIAGSYTVCCLLVLHGALRVSVLVATWIGATIGVAVQLHPRLAFHKAHNALYLVMGWLVIVGTPQLVSHLNGGRLVLLFAGGGLYTIGAAMLAFKWPDPWPKVFGFHEVWHLMVFAAALCHYLLFWQLIP